MIKNIIKRDGRVVLYDETKIASAILKALAAAGVGDAASAKQIADAVQENLTAACKDAPPQIEQIQDAVEKELMSAGFADAAKQYILYRANRTRIREANTSLMKSIDEITNVDARESDMKRDNANIDGNTAMGSMLQIGTAGAKAYNAAYLLTPAQAKAYNEGDIHIHDFDFYALTTTCCQIDLISLFKGGFSTGHGYLREPQSIASYAALAAIAIQSNQNDQHGGQGVPNFDYAMADGVRKTFSKVYARKLQEVLEDHLETENEKELAARAISAGESATGGVVRMGDDTEAFDAAVVKELFESGRLDNATAAHLVGNVRRRALQQTDRETYQAMEGFIHNLNTMHSRAGAQT
ncbi:MAG: anaerobic ribonucleoside-triphosphate reductase, partial [Ruthenibacterium sp.]